MAHAIQTCVHCGFCLAACPTYETLQQEMDSPRGRIFLMNETLAGRVDVAEILPRIDTCLGCLACEPACPSGVSYRDLISPFRTLTRDAADARRRLGEKIRHWLASAIITHPGRFRLVARLGCLARKLPRFLIPKTFRPMLELIPAHIPARWNWPALSPAPGVKKGRVALLKGCAQQVLAPEINTATIFALTHNGWDVLLPEDQVCCGALDWHAGDLSAAQWHAIRNLDAFPDDVAAIVTNAAGCGSGIHEYPVILEGTVHEERARAFAAKCVDITAFLAADPDLRPFTREVPRRVAYHDACHLSNGQGVRAQPRDLLRRIPKLTLVELPSAHRCCGSAGTYNLDQPETASELGALKAADIASIQPDCVATGNIGCLTQLRSHLPAGPPAVHTIEILAEAWGRPGTSDRTPR